MVQRQPSPDSPSRRFKGVRMRSWGKWVSEIRLPHTRARLWLGSYSTPEQAARAYDVALICLRGSSVSLNFPNSPPQNAPQGLSPRSIQELAAAAAGVASDEGNNSRDEECSAAQASEEECAAPRSEEQSSPSFPCFSEDDCRPMSTSSEEGSSLREEQCEAPGSEAQSSPCFHGVSEDDCTLRAPSGEEDLSRQAAELPIPEANSENSETLDSVLTAETLFRIQDWDIFPSFIDDLPWLSGASHWQHFSMSDSILPTDRFEDESAIFSEPYLWSS